MIKKCGFGQDDFEVRFEWPLDKRIMAGLDEAADIFSYLASSPEASLIEDDNFIYGFSISDRGWAALLAEKLQPGIADGIVRDFSKFLKFTRAAQNDQPEVLEG